MFLDICYLIDKKVTVNEYGHRSIELEDGRMVYCSIKSVSRTEYYMAKAQGINIDMVLVLGSDLEYNGEKIVKHRDKYYSVERSYITENGTVELSLKGRE